MTQSIDPLAFGPRETARLLTSIVVPRPIGWTSTISDAGALNLAPFSFFNAVGSNPPMVMLSISQRAGQPKDTLRNIQATGEFVINIADEALAEQMNLTSGEYGAEVDEFALAKLDAAPSLKVRPPRAAQAPAALEVKLRQVVPVVDTGYTLVIGQVLYFHLRDGLLRANGLVDAELLQPIARLGGDEYTTLGHIFTLTRPVV
ncbi:MAG: flavin reductase family protein [Caldilineaceae bacterium]